MKLHRWRTMQVLTDAGPALVVHPSQEFFWFILGSLYTRGLP